MNYLDLELLSIKELRSYEKKHNLKQSKTKGDILKNIMEARYKKYNFLGSLGEPGKDAITYLVTYNKQKYALKQFKSKKSVQKIKDEFEMQELAYEVGISPKPIDINIYRKYILMEKLDTHLIDVTKPKQLTLDNQKQLITIYKKLDNIHIFHGDPNPLNYMIKNKRLYVIDFGMSKYINSSMKKKVKSEKPNIELMTLSMVMKLKNMNFPESSYKYLIKHIPEEYQQIL